MGLFSNKNKPCPICGNATPRLFPDTVEGMPICKECAKKKDMPDHVFGGMTVEAFRQYIIFHQENQPLRNQFQQTFFWDDISMDVPRKLFRVSSRAESLVMEASCLRSFRILEDSNVLFESSLDGLRCYETDVPVRIHAAAPLIAQFNIQLEQFRQMERMRESMRRRGDGNDPPYISEPSFEYPLFQRGLGVELTLDHPYWGGTHSWYIRGPEFDTTYPRTDDCLRKFEKEMRRLNELAANLMSFLGGSTAEIRTSYSASAQGAGAVQTSAAAADPVTEIQRYKALLDSGVITEEEFTAKKRQLLGI